MSNKLNNKEASRFLESEIKDDYLEPLHDPLAGLYIPQKNSDKTDEGEPKIRKEEWKYFIKEPPIHFYFSRQKVTLTDKIFRAITQELSQDAQDCHQYLQEFKCIKNKQLLHHYQNLYLRTETPPILFLSVVPQDKKQDSIKSVLLWQIGACSVCKELNGWAVPLTDSRFLNTKGTDNNACLILLAKIVPEEDEEIIQAKLVQDTKLLVKSRRIDKENSGEVELSYKLFFIKNFDSTLVVNPIEKEPLATKSYSWKFTINSKENHDGSKAREVQIYRRKLLNEVDINNLKVQEDENGQQILEATEDELISTQIFCMKENSKEILCEESFSELIDSPLFGQDTVVLLDKETSTFLQIQGEQVRMVPIPQGSLHSYKITKERFFFLTKEGGIYSFDLKTISKPEISKVAYQLSSEVLQEQDFHWELMNIRDAENDFTYFTLIFSSKNKLFSLAIEDPECSPVLLYDVEPQFKENSKITSWTVLEKDTLSLTFLAFFLQSQSNLHLYNIQEGTLKSEKFDEAATKQNWKILASSAKALYIRDFSSNKEAFLSFELGSQQNLCLYKRFSHREEEETNQKGRNQVQMEGVGGQMLLVPGNEPVFTDSKHSVYQLPDKTFINGIREAKAKELPVNEPTEEEKIENAELIEKEKIQKVKQRISKAKNLKEMSEAANETLNELKSRVKEQADRVNEEYKEKYNQWDKSYPPSSWYDRNLYLPEKGEIPEKDVNLYKEIQAEKKKMKKTLMRENNKEKERKKKDRRIDGEFD